MDRPDTSKVLRNTKVVKELKNLFENKDRMSYHEKMKMYETYVKSDHFLSKVNELVVFDDDRITYSEKEDCTGIYKDYTKNSKNNSVVIPRFQFIGVQSEEIAEYLDDTFSWWSDDRLTYTFSAIKNDRILLTVTPTNK